MQTATIAENKKIFKDVREVDITRAIAKEFNACGLMIQAITNFSEWNSHLFPYFLGRIPNCDWIHHVSA